jgi:hypothetical protein
MPHGRGPSPPCGDTDTVGLIRRLFGADSLTLEGLADRRHEFLVAWEVLLGSCTATSQLLVATEDT